MRITDVILQQGGPEAVRRNAGVSRPQDSQKPAAAAPARGKDAYVPSQASGSRASEAEAATASAHAKAAPDVRQERINDVKEKIANGFYNSEEFKDKLADRLMKDFGF